MIEELRNGHGERLDFTFHAGEDERREVAVIGHGVTANKDRPWAVALAKALAARGHHALRLSFAGNGASEGDFRECTVTKEVADLSAVLDALADRPVTYVGHSMGAAVGVLRASRDHRITRLVSLGGMMDTAGFTHRKFGHLRPGVDTMWDKPECPLSAAFMEDMLRIGSVLDHAARIDVPWLLVHGTADQVVPLKDSTDVIARNTAAELVRMDDVDHVFYGAEGRMAEIVTNWLTE